MRSDYFDEREQKLSQLEEKKEIENVFFYIKKEGWKKKIVYDSNLNHSFFLPSFLNEARIEKIKLLGWENGETMKIEPLRFAAILILFYGDSKKLIIIIVLKIKK